MHKNEETKFQVSGESIKQAVLNKKVSFVEYRIKDKNT
jgi:hypothetical protein